MILSMTGFGKAVAVYANKKITAEIKSLNSKQLDLSTRLPQIYRSKELDLRNTIARSLERGKVDLFVTVENIDCDAPATINVPLLQKYKAEIIEMQSSLGLPEPADWYSLLLRMPDVLKSDNSAAEITEEELNTVQKVVEEAVNALMEFRAQEGVRLDKFFREKVETIGSLLADVEPLENERVTKIKARIQESLAKLDGVDYDRGRFEQEMIFYIEKLDINEEKLRLRNHLDYFIETMEGTRGQGKKLGFISQEMGREINTLGSKSNQAEMQNLVVRMKDQLEQIKEQVLNVM